MRFPSRQVSFGVLVGGCCVFLVVYLGLCGDIVLSLFSFFFFECPWLVQSCSLPSPVIDFPQPPPRLLAEGWCEFSFFLLLAFTLDSL